MTERPLDIVQGAFLIPTAPFFIAQKQIRFGMRFAVAYIVCMNATYTCNQCDMAVKAECAKCDVPLENGHLDLPDGSSVQVSRCPSCEGKIKSPQCCGSDMTCSM